MTTNHATDPLIGRTIDQRYRVRSRIARGGMATVYLATDIRLERRVAIKIMHAHLADDAAFRDRFIQEARSAARLSHPNVVGVFDQGSDGECAYIVMEYIPGITLRELLQEHTALTPTQTLEILRAVLAALASAHRAGMVHRDLKPENVLLADDGRIKLGDFGLARAASKNTATGAALLGTIAYLSPELVTRGVADTRSDIYALGIMLYEMLTGEQPYKGEQPMQIAYQHANDSVPPPSRAKPDVPPAFDELVRWSTARDPDARPADARDMLDGVDSLFPGGVSRGTPTAVIGADRATTVLPAGVWPDADESDTTILGDSAATTVLPPRQRPSTPAGGPTGPTLAPGQVLSPAAQRLATKTHVRRRRGWVLVIIIIVLAVIAAGLGYWFGPGPGGNVRIPATAGKSVSEAKQLLEANGLHTVKSIGSRYDASIVKGLVAASAPAAHAQVRKGSRVKLVVSQGPRLITLPAIVGRQYSTVRAALDDDFAIQTPAYQFNDAAKDTVIAASGQNTDGSALNLTTTTQYRQNAPITLTVSLGPVPKVNGETQTDATAALTAVGLQIGTVTQQYSDDVASDVVISSSTAASPVVQGSKVDLLVSKGPAPITLPNVSGKTITQAVSTLQNLGLKVEYPQCTNILCTFYDWKATLPVTGTDPAAGATVHKGDTITLKYEQ